MFPFLAGKAAGMNINDPLPDPEQLLLTQQNSLRKLIGILGMLLPVLLYAFLYLDNGYGRTLESISHYYFTRVCGIFVITLSLLAIFLIIYKGRALIDLLLSTLAGAAALLVLLFPTNNIKPGADGYRCAVTFLNDSDLRVNLHYIAAAVFLLSLAGMALFLFTRSDKPKALRTPQKNTRNIIFRICGIVMITAIVIIFLDRKHIIYLPVFGDSLTFWMETVAVECFGFAWLVKGEMFFGDKG